MNTPHHTAALALSLLISFSAHATKIYAWIDSDGVIHYTDAPPQGAKANEIDLRVTPLLGGAPRSTHVDNGNNLAGSEGKQDQKTAALAIALLFPESGSTLRDNTGNIIFQGTISPAAPSQYEVRLTLDGKAYPVVSNSVTIKVENLDRGAHQANLTLLAKDGTILAQSPSVIFYLHRASMTPAPRPTPRMNQG
ncbi:MAG: DUF4124 domain-containing protein [Aeromonas sp.]